MLKGEGYWGPRTASVDWCEKNYIYSFYIAEFWNTLSSFVISGLSLYGIWKCYQKNFEWRFFLVYFLVFVVGIGSVAFHGTLLFTGQALDELPMIYASLVYLYIFSENTLKRKYRYLTHALFCYALLFTLFYLNLPNSIYFIFFLGSYVLIVGYLCVQCFFVVRKARKEYGQNHPIAKHLTMLFGLSSITYLSGSLLFWIPEVLLCPKYLSSEWNLHAWFHLTSSVGTYSFTMFLCYNRALVLGLKPSLEFPMILPVVKTGVRKEE